MLMGAVFIWGVISLSAQPADDPVMRIKAQRQAKGESTPDGLRPVQEPPPLPPVESHVKDTRGYRAGRKARAKARKGASRKAGARKGQKSESKSIKKKVVRKR